MNVASLFDPPRLSGTHLRGVLSSGWLTTGPLCEKLQDALARVFKVPARWICLTSSATAGFQAVLDLLHHQGWSKVSITDATWPGMHQAIFHAGMSRRPLHEAEVIVTTDIGGARLADGDLADAEGARPWIHDACHSWFPCARADFSIASFYPTKLVPGAEGGVVVCRQDEAADFLRQWIYCGLRPGAAGNGEPPACWGRKANMTDVTAALNLEALERAPAYMDGIRKSWEVYRRLATEKGIAYRWIHFRPYLFQIEVPGDKVQAVREGLKHWGVPTAWNFKPAGLVTLPLYPDMSEMVQAMVLDQVLKVVKELRLPRPT